MQDEILHGYADAAHSGLIDRLEAICSADLFAPVRTHIPDLPCRILDVGAGTGRDAAWLAAQSHDVVAVEPVDALRNAGISKHGLTEITWVKDTLPNLLHTQQLGQTFDVIILCAVWQHLNRGGRETALAALRRLCSDTGKIIMSIRQGAGAQTRPIYPADLDDTIARAKQHGFHVLPPIPAPSVQPENRQAGVTWTWLVAKPKL